MDWYGELATLHPGPHAQWDGAASGSAARGPGLHPAPMTGRERGEKRGGALTQQLDTPRETVHVHQGPEWIGRADSVEEEHGSGIIDAVEDVALLVHPEGDDVALVGKLLGQCLGPETTLGHEVGAGILRQRVRVDARRVLAGEAQTQGTAPAALLPCDLVAQDGAVGEEGLNPVTPSPAS